MDIKSFEENLVFNEERIVTNVVIETTFSKEIRASEMVLRAFGKSIVILSKPFKW